ncbi:hypothetical protein BDN72DRAFT_899776 [Pluteus cervinus]|uniref:Uncharacterized protein n=1 Tax=Pluteus cervinus TaxID=181527 RepID=A0ACD3AME4_9AGAR|nr:hypothetical protein BDN72DRAFT_899776 [Pluteus cervinus]
MQISAESLTGDDDYQRQRKEARLIPDGIRDLILPPPRTSTVAELLTLLSSMDHNSASPPKPIYSKRPPTIDVPLSSGDITVLRQFLLNIIGHLSALDESFSRALRLGARSLQAADNPDYRVPLWSIQLLWDMRQPSFVYLQLYTPFRFNSPVLTSPSCPELSSSTFVRIPKTHIVFSLAGYAITQKDVATSDAHPVMVATLAADAQRLYSTFSQHVEEVADAVAALKTDKLKVDVDIVDSDDSDDSDEDTDNKD